MLVRNVTIGDGRDCMLYLAWLGTGRTKVGLTATHAAATGSLNMAHWPSPGLPTVACPPSVPWNNPRTGRYSLMLAHLLGAVRPTTAAPPQGAACLHAYSIVTVRV